MKLHLPLAALALALSVAALADWGHPLKWDQFDSIDSRAAESWRTHSGSYFYLAADDFLCTQTGWVSEIRVAGIDDPFNLGVQVMIWSDVPAGPTDESHPGDLLYSVKLGVADPNDPHKVGWWDAGDGTFRINLPENNWFWQEGTPDDPIVYWVGVQAYHDIFGFEKFRWKFRDPSRQWGDDAVFSTNGVTWSHWGVDPTGAIRLYDGTLPAGWSSVDLAFQVYGTPEPATWAIFGLGAFALLRRRRR